MTHCEICWVQLAPSIEGYKTHLQKIHGVKSRVVTPITIPDTYKPVIKPIRTTTRSKVQIVHDMEKFWGNAIIPTVRPWHAVGEAL